MKRLTFHKGEGVGSFSIIYGDQGFAVGKALTLMRKFPDFHEWINELITNIHMSIFSNT